MELDFDLEKLRVLVKGIDQIPAELTNAGGRKIRYEILTLISILSKEELPEE